MALQAAFEYINGRLHMNTSPRPVDLDQLIKNEGTPAYIYNIEDVRRRVRFYLTLFQNSGCRHQVHYAVKANHNVEILKEVAKAGAGFDVVSEGEIRACEAAGCPVSEIVFSGVGKSERELRYAISKEIKQINIESPAELKRVIALAREMNIRPRVALRLNPDVEADTHPHIKTGFRDNKFGMSEPDIMSLVSSTLAQNQNVVEFVGLTLHIGSQILDIGAFAESLRRAGRVQIDLIKSGWPLYRFDLGGGLGIRYDLESPAEEERLALEYSANLTPLLEKLKENTKNKDFEILTEPGRFLVARSGLLITRIEYIKKSVNSDSKVFVIVDSGMNHLMRPALYGAKHRILPLAWAQSTPVERVDVVGPICESADVFGRGVDLPAMQEGDLLAIFDVGAYGACMANQYNLRTPARELIIDPTLSP